MSSDESENTRAEHEKHAIFRRNCVIGHHQNVVAAICYISEHTSMLNHPVPSMTSKQTGDKWVGELLRGTRVRFHDSFMMSQEIFIDLLHALEEKCGFKGTRRTATREVLALTIYILSHNESMRKTRERFQHSTETTSRFFARGIRALLQLAEEVIQPSDRSFGCTPPEIMYDRRYMPFFKDCVGAIDGTHVDACIPVGSQVPYIGRKGRPTQNVMAACDFNMCFTFVMAGWEGSAHDSRIFNYAITDPRYTFPHPPQVDIITAIEFDKSGDHLATGDKGGRVVLFERTDAKEHGSRRDLERQNYTINTHPEFRYKTEFQSHEPEFDYLKSLEIEERINKIRWWQNSNSSLFLLSTNDKTIKFWKVQEKKVKKISEMNVDPSQAARNGPSSSTSCPRVCLPNGGCSGGPYKNLSYEFNFPPGGFPTLRLPVVAASQETCLLVRCRRVYAHAHEYYINSISNNSDGETFISVDDLRINLWNMEISSQCFNIVDVKPANMEDLTEVITSAEFHPMQCNTLAYSSTKGSIRLVDLRQSALCDNHSKLFEEREAPGSRSFFSEIIGSISDIKFSKDGRHILSRDYMTLKLWDINMDSGPITTFQVHEYLRSKLCDLYENDSLFDKFECSISGNALRVATGSYSNIFHVFGCASGSTEATTLEACKNPMRRQVQTPARPAKSLSGPTRVVRRGSNSPGADTNASSYDFTTKVVHLAWHPAENSIACATANSLYMYYA